MRWSPFGWWNWQARSLGRGRRSKIPGLGFEQLPDRSSPSAVALGELTLPGIPVGTGPPAGEVQVLAPGPANSGHPAFEQDRRELVQAQQVQLSLLPAQPDVPGYEFSAYYRPAREVGGDSYDFIPLPTRRLAITVGDVAGKGVPAALLMAKVSADAQFCFQLEEDPAAALNRLNARLYPHASAVGRFVTFTAAVLDAESHAVTLVNAGHPPPLLYRPGTGAVQEALPGGTAGLPLGVEKGEVYRAFRVGLQPGDCLILYSDGVTEAMDE